jgi:hypothetical protein
MSSANRTRRLLVLACSATKRPDPGRIPARLRYDGPLWRTLRATDPDDRLVRVAFLSLVSGSATPGPKSKTTTPGSPATSQTA